MPRAIHDGLCASKPRKTCTLRVNHLEPGFGLPPGGGGTPRPGVEAPVAVGGGGGGVVAVGGGAVLVCAGGGGGVVVPAVPLAPGVPFTFTGWNGAPVDGGGVFVARGCVRGCCGVGCACVVSAGASWGTCEVDSAARAGGGGAGVVTPPDTGPAARAPPPPRAGSR